MTYLDRPLSYIEAIAQRIWWATGESDPLYPADEQALWLAYALLALTTGKATTSENVHDAWALWAVMRHNGVHRSLVPFGGLTPDVQSYDDLYRDAICRVATNLRGAMGR